MKEALRFVLTCIGVLIGTWDNRPHAWYVWPILAVGPVPHRRDDVGSVFGVRIGWLRWELTVLFTREVIE